MAVEDRGVSSTQRGIGEFYTPQWLCDEFHSLIEDCIPDVHENYIVWDPAWGQGALTKGFEAKEMYCSTLRKRDIQIARRISPGATKFEYDFLNDDVAQLESMQNLLTEEYTMPESLVDHLNDKDTNLLIMMNPPYVGIGKYRGTVSKGQDQAIESRVRQLMKGAGHGISGNNMYTQFIYRVVKMAKTYKAKIHLAVICPPQYMCTSGYREFRAEFLKYFKYAGGKLTKASCFEGVSSLWGISLTVWTAGENTENVFKHKIISDPSKESETILEEFGVKDGYKELYNCDEVGSATDELRDKIYGLLNPADKEQTFCVSCGTRLKEKELYSYKGAMGSMYIHSNSIEKNENYMTITSGAPSLMAAGSAGIPLTKETAQYVLPYFTVRAIMRRPYSSWLNVRDEYMIPHVVTNETEFTEAMNRIKYDSMVASIFSGSCSVSSIKDAWYIDAITKEKVMKRSKNELFWLSKAQVMELSHGDITDECYQDDSEAWAYTVLDQYKQNGLLSDTALEVIAEANRILEKSWPLRKKYQGEQVELDNQDETGQMGVSVDEDVDTLEDETLDDYAGIKASKEYVDLQLGNWDAGWWQIKQLIMRELYDDYKQFNTVFNKFRRELIKCIYKAGYLR